MDAHSNCFSGVWMSLDIAFKDHWIMLYRHLPFVSLWLFVYQIEHCEFARPVKEDGHWMC